MTKLNSTLSRRIFTGGMGPVILGIIAACSGQAKDSLEGYSLKPGWYKLEGQHRVSVFPDGAPEKIIEEFPLDSFACVTAEDARRRSEEEVVQGMTAEGYDVLEVNITPYKDSVRAVSPPNDTVRDSISFTVIEYNSEFNVMTMTLEGAGETDEGPLKLITKITNTWVSDDCLDT